MRLLTITTFFPNGRFPFRTLFVKNLVVAMRKLIPLSVIAPVPYSLPIHFPYRWFPQGSVDRVEQIDGIEVLHPRYLVIPKVNWLSAITYFAALFSLVRRARSVSEPLIIHAHCAFPDGVGAALVARWFGLPYVITAHGSDINVYAEKMLIRPQIRWAIKRANGVIAVSRALESRIKTLARTSSLRIAYIPCAGFDSEIFSPRSRNDAITSLSLSADSRVVVFVGNLVPVKGTHRLVAAWALLMARQEVTGNDRLIIIGDGPEGNLRIKQIADSGLATSVILIGAVSQATVSNWVAAATLLCLPSDNEGTPNVIVEALAMGVPTVASRVGGIPDLIEEGVNGFMVEPGNVDALANALAKGLTQEWDHQVIRRSASHLTWPALANQNLLFIQSACREDSG